MHFDGRVCTLLTIVMVVEMLMMMVEGEMKDGVTACLPTT